MAARQQRSLSRASTASSLYDDRMDAPPTRSQSLELGASPVPSPRAAARRRPHPMRYAFAQAFGERGADTTPAVVVQEADMISAVRFDGGSDMVATGDKGGRIVILKRVGRGKGGRGGDVMRGMRRRQREGRGNRWEVEDGEGEGEEEGDEVEGQTDGEDDEGFVDPPEFRFWTQFQSHEPEFDYLKSMEIEEKINQIRWCRQVSGAQRLIATNDKTIKLWRVYEKEVKSVAVMDPASLLRPRTTTTYSRASSSASRSPQSPQSPQSAALGMQPGISGAPGSSSGTARRPLRSRSRSPSPDPFQLEIPRLELKGRVITATPRRVFSNAHAYHINSISLNSDEETFLSADDLRVNLWNLNAGGNGFNILDIKPDNMEDLTEVITAAEFHPRHCHLFMHSSSRGIVKLCDLRQSALCDSWARQFEEVQDVSSRMSFFSEIIASISDVKFSPDGRYILTRDYMNLRLWDINMERTPVLVVPVHEHLRSRLCDLYENDCIFDKFQCAFSSDGGSLLTGSYNSLFQSYSADNGQGAAVEASVDFVSGLSGRHHFSHEGLSANLIAGSSAAELVDPSRRIMHLDASPTEQVAAVAAGPALYLYYGTP